MALSDITNFGRLNPKDLQIISHLRRDARMSLTTMSRKTSIPVSTIFDRLKINEDSLIIKHTCLLNYSKLGYNVRANITLKVNKDDKDSLKEYLIRHPAINSVYRINNGFDFMVEAIFKQLKDMEEFIELLENRFRMEEHKSFFIIEDLKREEFMSNLDILL